MSKHSTATDVCPHDNVEWRDSQALCHDCRQIVGRLGDDNLPLLEARYQELLATFERLRAEETEGESS